MVVVAMSGKALGVIQHRFLVLNDSKDEIRHISHVKRSQRAYSPVVENIKASKHQI